MNRKQVLTIGDQNMAVRAIMQQVMCERNIREWQAIADRSGTKFIKADELWAQVLFMCEYGFNLSAATSLSHFGSDVQDRFIAACVMVHGIHPIPDYLKE